MKFSPIVLAAGLATTATAHVVAPHGKVAPLLDVDLVRDGNSGVHVTIANNGDRDLKLLSTGTILDDGPVEKLQVNKGNKKVGFRGVEKTISTDVANDEVKGAKMWTVLKRNEKITKKVDAGELHDLREGGHFIAKAAGTIPYSDLSDHKLRGVARYSSNAINLDSVDGKQAEESFHNLLNARSSVEDKLDHLRRAEIQSDCQGDQLTQMQSALSICADVSRKASAAAANGERLAEYFQTADNGTAGIVSSRLTQVADQCADHTSSDIKLYCQQDVANACSDGVIAYTLPSTSQIAMCELFWTYDKPNPDAAGCHGQDQGTTILHEFTHAGAVLSDPTTDNGYGFDAIQGLSPQENINNADTYALYANGIDQNC